MTSEISPTEDAAPPAEPEQEQSLPTAPERLDEEGLTDLARRIVTNRTFITWDPEVARMSFLPIMLGVIRPDSAAVYEDFEKAGERGVNGYPSFFSANFLHIEDAIPLIERMNTMLAALGLPTILVTIEPKPEPSAEG